LASEIVNLFLLLVGKLKYIIVIGAGQEISRLVRLPQCLGWALPVFMVPETDR